MFSLNAILTEKAQVADPTQEVREFTATRSPEGLLQMRGRLPDDGAETIVGSFARAKFGSTQVYLATRDDETLPVDWSVRVLAGLEALALLDHGSVAVNEEMLELRGVSGNKSASDELSQLLANKLSDTDQFEVNVRYDELLDKTLNIPTPQECVERINTILAAGKIAFEPSSAEISASAEATIEAIANIAKQCDRVQMEIGGHTDSQGRETMNEALSQQRADAVLLALQQRRVRTRNFTARGYGEAEPIADNGSEAGREANRRIEFKLLTDARAAATDEASDSETTEDTTQAEGESE